MTSLLVRSFCLLYGSLALFASDLPKGNFGASGSSTTPEKPATATKKRNSYPYSGELESFDARSITLKGKSKPRVLLLAPETRVLQNGAKTRLEKAVAGERVTGSTRKNADGKEEALTINLKGVQPAK